MQESRDLTLGIILASVASLTSFVLVLWACVCCYRPNKEDGDEDWGQIEARRTDTPDRSDVKQLHKHAWDARSKSPLLSPITGKTIKFERPTDKRFVTENVQPDQFSQTSLNQSLGVRSKNALLSPNNTGRDSDSGSASSSPFHVRRTIDADLEAGATGPELPMDEPEYFMGGEKLGRIQFSLNYNFQEMTLTLRILRATDLPAKDFSGTSDPYVKILLLPDKKHKLTTNIKRKNLNPRWNEIFAFEGFPYSKLMSRTLYMQILDYDRFSRDDPIGEVCLPLSDVDLSTGQTIWKYLQPSKGHAGKLGELLLSLCYQPTVGRITVVVMKARELKSKDINGLSDPYVKIWLMFDGKKVEKKKTQIKEKTLNPVYNESFIFNVPYERIRQTCLAISVMDYDRMGRNELIGQIVLGTKSGSMEVKHWNEMFAKSRQPVAQWHILKDFG